MRPLFFFLQTGPLKVNPGFVAIRFNPIAYNFGLSECNRVNMNRCGMSEVQTKHHTSQIIDYNLSLKTHSDMLSCYHNSLVIRQIFFSAKIILTRPVTGTG